MDGENTVEIWAKQKQTSGVKVAKHLGKISDIETVKKTFNDKLSTFQSKPTKSGHCGILVLHKTLDVKWSLIMTNMRNQSVISLFRQ